MIGMANATRAMAAATQVMRQPTSPIMVTARIGIAASLAEKPRTAIEIARPRRRLNHRAMAVIATCTIMPWPKKRRPNRAMASIQAEVTDAITRVASARPAITAALRIRIGNRSASLPAHTRMAALPSVPMV